MGRMSLLREIQNDLVSEGGDVTAVLRKCKILASRLGSDEFAQWVDGELNGYSPSQPTPPYRRLAIQYYASFTNPVWQATRQPVPLQLVPKEHRGSFESIEFREGIAKADSFVRAGKGALIERPELIFVLQGKMYPRWIVRQLGPRFLLSNSSSLLAAVKSRVLDFVLKIETENPNAGEAQPNSQPVPTEKLRPLVQNVFYAPVGNIAQNSDNLSQTANIGIQTETSPGSWRNSAIVSAN